MQWKIIVEGAGIAPCATEEISTSELMEILPVLLKPSMFGTGNFTFTVKPIKKTAKD